MKKAISTAAIVLAASATTATGMYATSNPKAPKLETVSVPYSGKLDDHLWLNCKKIGFDKQINMPIEDMTTITEIGTVPEGWNCRVQREVR